MIPLDDPLWSDLPDARRRNGVGARLEALFAKWTKDAAFDLDYDLTLDRAPSPAAIAALPHLLNFALISPGKRARTGALELAANILTRQSAVLAINAQADAFPDPFPGARQLKTRMWNETLDARLAGQLEESLSAQKLIARDIFPEAVMSARGEVAQRLLAGLAGAWEEHLLARALDFGEDGIVRCAACGDCCLWLAFPGTIAIYTNWDEGRRSPEVRDLKEGAPNRADGRFLPADRTEMRIGQLAVLDAANREETRLAHDIVRHFAGAFPCPRCGAEGAPLTL